MMCRHAEVYSDGNCADCFDRGERKGIAEGRKLERADVVADLRSENLKAKYQKNVGWFVMDKLSWRYERGDHVRRRDDNG